MKIKKLTKAREDAHKARTVKNRAVLKAQIEREENKVLKSALRVIYTWSGVEGALVPEHVRNLAGRALGKIQDQES